MNEGAVDPPELVMAVPTELPEGGKRTAEKAKNWLVSERHERGYRSVDRRERVLVTQAFAAHNKVVYGQAFDLVRVANEANVNFGDLPALTDAVTRRELVLIEVKASRITRVSSGHFGGHFFSLSTAELLVAQSLGDLYRFAFVNVETGEAYEASLQQIYRRARAIYPTWSIRLDDQEFPPDAAI